MSIGSGNLTSASDDDTEPPYSAQQVALSEWPDRVKRAWQAFQSVNKGDTVIWGERSKPLTVTEITDLEDGEKNVGVEGPRGGTYTLRKRYSDDGNPTFYADDSKAMDLRLYEQDNTGEDMRPFTEDMYEQVIENLKRAAINNYVEEEYDEFDEAVEAVVVSWIADVEFMRWSGWPYEWQDDDPTYIYRMIREHADRLPQPDPATTDRTTTEPSVGPKAQARLILIEEVTERGKEIAHRKLIESEQDYRAHVMALADEAIEHDDLKANLDGRAASAQVVENFIEDHTEPVWRSIIEYSNSEPDDISLYEGLEPEKITREMAYDILDADVWERARELHAERGTHDPTVRGLAFFEYDQLVEYLVEETLREHRINDNNRLFTTAKQVARGFAENVENRHWPYDIGGVDEDTWGAGDTEDIFTSITMHAEPDPKVFNPFSADRQRKAAQQVLTEVVHERASDAMDEKQADNVEPVPADQYLEEEIGTDLTFNDIRNDTGIEPKEFIAESIANLDDDEEPLGYTFVDELVEAAGATVPFISGPWQLVDYGVVQTNDKERTLAYFDRSSGNVLTLSGSVDGRPIDGDYTFGDNWHVALHQWDGEDTPTYLQRDSTLDFAWEFTREYIGADSNDVNVIETSDGEHYVMENIEQDDIDASKISGGAARTFRITGPGLTSADKLTYGKQILSRVAEFILENSRLVKSITVVAAGSFLAELPYLAYAAPISMTVEPHFDKKYGVGVQTQADFGQKSDKLEQYDPEDPDSDFYQGRIDAKATITPGAMKFLANSITPEWLYQAGPDATILSTLQSRVERPIREKTGDLLRAPRVAFLGAHIPEEARGAPTPQADYAEETTVTVEDYDEEISVQINTQYPEKLVQDGQLMSGRALPDSKVKQYLARLARHGYIVETNSGTYYWGGDEDLDAEVDEPFDLHQLEQGKPLSPAEVKMLGYSLRRHQFLGRSGITPETFFGTPQEVAENVNTEDDLQNINTGDLEPVCTNKAMLKIWTELPGTPNTTVLSTMWEFYKARAEDTDEMTILDAYNRYRMGILYTAIESATITEIGNHLSRISRDDNRDLERAFERTDPTAERAAREYYYKPTEPQLHPREIWDSEDHDEIGSFIVFPEDSNETSRDFRPSRDVSHYYFDEATNDYYYWDADAGREVEYAGGAKSPTNVGEDEIRQREITDYQSLFRSLNRGTQNDIAEKINNSYIKTLVTDPEEFDPDDPVPEEQRKWLDKDKTDRIAAAARGSEDWDDLDGTDISIFGLFLRGVNSSTVETVADQFNLSDRFRTRFSDIMPEDRLPERGDRPSFGEWLENRRSPNAIGSATEKARAKARYLREIAGTANDSPTSRDFIGASDSAMEASDRQRELNKLLDNDLPDTDYRSFEEFYGEQYGNAFDDVAQKFNETQTTDEVDPIGDMDQLVADDQPNTGPTADYGDDESENDNNES